MSTTDLTMHNSDGEDEANLLMGDNNTEEDLNVDPDNNEDHDGVEDIISDTEESDLNHDIDNSNDVTALTAGNNNNDDESDYFEDDVDEEEEDSEFDDEEHKTTTTIDGSENNSTGGGGGVNMKILFLIIFVVTGLGIVGYYFMNSGSDKVNKGKLESKSKDDKDSDEKSKSDGEKNGKSDGSEKSKENKDGDAKTGSDKSKKDLDKDKEKDKDVKPDSEKTQEKKPESDSEKGPSGSESESKPSSEKGSSDSVTDKTTNPDIVATDSSTATTTAAVDPSQQTSGSPPTPGEKTPLSYSESNDPAFSGLGGDIAVKINGGESQSTNTSSDKANAESSNSSDGKSPISDSTNKSLPPNPNIKHKPLPPLPRSHQKVSKFTILCGLLVLPALAAFLLFLGLTEVQVSSSSSQIEFGTHFTPCKNVRQLMALILCGISVLIILVGFSSVGPCMKKPKSARELLKDDEVKRRTIMLKSESDSKANSIINTKTSDSESDLDGLLTDSQRQLLTEMAKAEDLMEQDKKKMTDSKQRIEMRELNKDFNLSERNVYKKWKEKHGQTSETSAEPAADTATDNISMPEKDSKKKSKSNSKTKTTKSNGRGCCGNANKLGTMLCFFGFLLLAFSVFLFVQNALTDRNFLANFKTNLNPIVSDKEVNAPITSASILNRASGETSVLSVGLLCIALCFFYAGMSACRPGREELQVDQKDRLDLEEWSKIRNSEEYKEFKKENIGKSMISSHSSSGDHGSGKSKSEEKKGKDKKDKKDSDSSDDKKREKKDKKKKENGK